VGAWETERNGGTMEAENDFATTLEREAFIVPLRS